MTLITSLANSWGKKKRYSRQKKLISSLRGRKQSSTRLFPIDADISKNTCIISIFSLIYIHTNKTGCKVHNSLHHCHVVWIGNHLTRWNRKYTWYISVSIADEFPVLATYCHYHGDFTYIMTCFKRTKSSCKAISMHLRTKACYRKTPHFLAHETNSRALISTKTTKTKQENCPHCPTTAKQAYSCDTVTEFWRELKKILHKRLLKSEVVRRRDEKSEY